MAKKPTLIYQIRVSLDDTHPPVWRRILAPGSTTLLKLHDILQTVMGSYVLLVPGDDEN
jgi:hypothetical protein